METIVRQLTVREPNVTIVVTRPAARWMGRTSFLVHRFAWRWGERLYFVAHRNNDPFPIADPFDPRLVFLAPQLVLLQPGVADAR